MDKTRRITPAHAGRISSAIRSNTARQDHPRACGKNAPEPPKPDKIGGSPPRMREEYRSAFAGNIVGGITPAHAGRIFMTAVAPVKSWDHPRACGKNHTRAECAHAHLGSPPRMREESEYLGGASTPVRITPAHAGRIPIDTSIKSPRRDHPRACGKNPVYGIPDIGGRGSPPRMREEC